MFNKSGKQYVLFVWDIAGVASNLIKYQKRCLGWENCAIIIKGNVPFNIPFYGNIYDRGSKYFYFITIIKSLKYKIIHINSVYKIAKIIKILFPWKKVVIHFHGTEIRRRWHEMKIFWEHADIILVSTPDLLEGAPKKAKYLPNMVDTDIFKPNLKNRIPNSALFVFIQRSELTEKGALCSSTENLNWAKKISKDMNLELTILYRDEKPIPYNELPEYLNRFEYFIDRKQFLSLSKMALEALACGLKVIRWDNKVIEGLPEQHKPEKVVKILEKIYFEPGNQS